MVMLSIGVLGVIWLVVGGVVLAGYVMNRRK